MYRKLSEFEIQFNRWLGKLLSLITLFWHEKVTENVVDSRRRWFHWAATIIPLPKVKVMTELEELRPVSLTPDLGKILEGFVARTILADIRPNIDRRQYGNLKGNSTSHYLIYLLDEIYRGLDQRHNIACLILIDFKKAFDFVNHNVAIVDLLKMGCRASLIPFVTDFLSNRRHRVMYQGETTDFAPITCGVPQ